MRKFGFITNKYAISGLILLCLVLADVLLHRSMSRVILPASFSDKISTVSLPLCNTLPVIKNKHWIVGVNTVDQLKNLSNDIGGFSTRLWFSIKDKKFYCLELNGNTGSTPADSLFAFCKEKKPGLGICIKIDNLNSQNVAAIFTAINQLKKSYSLSNPIIESAAAEQLKIFCDSGYASSYSVPDFNPYQDEEEAIVSKVDSIRHILMQFPASALSCAYYQYPILKKIFPNYPLITDVDRNHISMVSFIFRHQLDNDERIKVILSPSIE